MKTTTRALRKFIQEAMTNTDHVKPVEEANDTFFVRDELLDLEEDMQVALTELDDFFAANRELELHVDLNKANGALDKLHDVARKLKQAAGLSPSKPPPLG